MAGLRMGSEVSSVNSGGYYWTRTENQNDKTEAYMVSFIAKGWAPATAVGKCAGLSVRPVIDENLSIL